MLKCTNINVIPKIEKKNCFNFFVKMPIWLPNHTSWLVSTELQDVQNGKENDQLTEKGGFYRYLNAVCLLRSTIRAKSCIKIKVYLILQ